MRARPSFTHKFCAASAVPKRRSQAGAALIVFMILVVLGLATVLVTRMNPNSERVAAAQRTADALAQAKSALIGYAASSPTRPGQLPCPDFNNDGRITAADDYVGTNCKVRVGWLPWATLGLPDLRDGAGERLWYAVSDDFQEGHTTPLNSETPAQLYLDGNTEQVIALVLAPGAPTPMQSGRPGSDAAASVSQYLEGDNADGDLSFASTDSGMNDSVLAVSWNELMPQVERRVAGEIAHALRLYRAKYGQYPWFASFSNPPNASYKSGIDVREGLLPVHLVNEAFGTGMDVTWNFPVGTTPDIVQQIDAGHGVSLASAILGAGSPKNVTSATCRWTVRDRVVCTGEASELAPYPGVQKRVYRFDLVYDGDTPATVTPPTAAAYRTRSVSHSGPVAPSGAYVIEVIDFADVTGTTQNGLARVGSTSTGTVTVSGIKYDLDTGSVGNEIPDWIIANNWHHQLYVAEAKLVAQGRATGGSAGPPATLEDISGVDFSQVNSGDVIQNVTDGSAGRVQSVTVTPPSNLTASLAGGIENDFDAGDVYAACHPWRGSPPQCLRVTGERERKDVQALVVVAGRPLAGQDRTASPDLADYYEADPLGAAPAPSNATAGDDEFVERPISAQLNDQVRIVEP